MKITKSPLPENSQVKNFLPSDYVDTYSVIVSEHSQLTPDNILITFWTDFPAWLQMLFKLRNYLVKPFGLKAGNIDKNFEQKLEEAIRNGSQPDFLMTVPAKTANETVVRLTDKHLTAELSVYNEKLNDNKLKINITTLVHYHNTLGKIYFFFIRPFHKIIVKAVTKRSIKRSICR
jgi:hypothetical protein